MDYSAALDAYRKAWHECEAARKAYVAAPLRDPVASARACSAFLEARARLGVAEATLDVAELATEHAP